MNVFRTTVSEIGKTLSALMVVSYLFALLLELWRPGFVTFFWNPQILLVLAIIGAITGSIATTNKEKYVGSFVFFIIFAIVTLFLEVSLFPKSNTRIAVVLLTIILILIFIFGLRKKNQH